MTKDRIIQYTAIAILVGIVSLFGYYIVQSTYHVIQQAQTAIKINSLREALDRFHQESELRPLLDRHGQPSRKLSPEEAKQVIAFIAVRSTAGNLETDPKLARQGIINDHLGKPLTIEIRDDGKGGSEFHVSQTP